MERVLLPCRSFTQETSVSSIFPARVILREERPKDPYPFGVWA
jgi:hypothetical protein